MRLRKCQNKKGALLLELLFAFVLLAFVVVSSGGLLTKAAQMSETNKGRLLALQAAQSALETIKDTPLTSITSVNTAALIPANLYRGSITIQTAPATITTATQIADVFVTVSWRTAANRLQSLQVSTRRSCF